MTTPATPRVKRKRGSSGKGFASSRAGTPPTPHPGRPVDIAPHPAPLPNAGAVAMAASMQ